MLEDFPGIPWLGSDWMTIMDGVRAWLRGQNPYLPYTTYAHTLTPPVGMYTCLIASIYLLLWHCQDRRISGAAAAKKAPYPADTDLPSAARTAVMAGSGGSDRAGLADDRNSWRG